MKIQSFGNTDNYLDLSFSERVIVLASLVPKGKLVTYGDIAKVAGGGGMAAQSITSILGRAQKTMGLPVPFHRIVYANGRVWLDGDHEIERMRLYNKEGIGIDGRGMVENFDNKRFDFRAVKVDELSKWIKKVRQFSAKCNKID